MDIIQVGRESYSPPQLILFLSYSRIAMILEEHVLLLRAYSIIEREDNRVAAMPADIDREKQYNKIIRDRLFLIFSFYFVYERDQIL